MTTRQSLIFGLSLIVCCAILGTCFGPPVAAQAKPVQLMTGRYNIIDRRSEGSSVSYILLDNATGHCWERRIESHSSSRFTWHDIGAPPQEIEESSP